MAILHDKPIVSILRTFWDREGISTGVLLAGEKGSGTTFLAKLLSVQAASQPCNCPTIVINQPHRVVKQFNAFLQSIRQPAVVVFDEFEKVFSGGGRQRYHDDDGGVEISLLPAQDSMLTLLDGTHPSKMLFVFTSNDKNKISSNTRNRPGLVYYYVIDFHGLSIKFIREYCEDNLKDQGQLGSVIAVSSVFEAFNFDMLQALVEEMNRYKESADEALEFLNVEPDFQAGGSFQLELTFLNNNNNNNNNNNTDAELLLSCEHYWSGNPLTRVISVPYHHRKRKESSQDDGDDDDDDDDEQQHWDIDGSSSSRRRRARNKHATLEVTAAEHLVSVDAEEGKLTYFDEKNRARVVLTKHRHTPPRLATGSYLSYSKLATPHGEMTI